MYIHTHINTHTHRHTHTHIHRHIYIYIYIYIMYIYYIYCIYYRYICVCILCMYIHNSLKTYLFLKNISLSLQKLRQYNINLGKHQIKINTGINAKQLKLQKK